MESISVKDLAARMKSDNAPILIDVREPHEHDYARIEGAQLKPLGDIYTWVQELDREREYVIHCHTGRRSAYAAQVLRQMGFKKVKNLTGGIDAWSAQVDPNVPRY